MDMDAKQLPTNTPPKPKSHPYKRWGQTVDVGGWGFLKHAPVVSKRMPSWLAFGIACAVEGNQ
eukprot:1765522-Amphidinium_carterae.1